MELNSKLNNKGDINMEIRQQLPLVAVEYENNGKKAVLTFLDEERGEVRSVNFNKQIYANDKYVDDDEKAAKVEKWCADIFNTTFDNLTTALETKHDVYCYDKFNALFEIEQISKFTEDMKGLMLDTEIKEILVDDYFIKIRYDYDGKTYESKQTYGKYMESMKQWFQDPQKKQLEYDKFEKKYGVPVSQRDTLIGMHIFVEVKCAFKKFYYGDIKPFPKAK